MRKFVVALLLTVLVGGVAVARANDNHQIAPGNGLSPQDRLGVQGEHHPFGRDLGLIDGRDLVIDDIIVGTDRIAVRYHATGIQMIQFGDLGNDPLIAQEGPTLIIAIADGQSLSRYEGSDSTQGGSHAVSGEMVFRWSGGAFHHLVISILRIMGDVHAAWTTSFDF
jgi:hypothetical protein